jgi:hypothetical protein
VPLGRACRHGPSLSPGGSSNATDAQLLAFEDTWHAWSSAEATYAYLTNTARHEGRVPDKVSADR